MGFWWPWGGLVNDVNPPPIPRLQNRVISGSLWSFEGDRDMWAWWLSLPTTSLWQMWMIPLYLNCRGLCRECFTSNSPKAKYSSLGMWLYLYMMVLNHSWQPRNFPLTWLVMTKNHSPTLPPPPHHHIWCWHISGSDVWWMPHSFGNDPQIYIPKWIWHGNMGRSAPWSLLNRPSILCTPLRYGDLTQWTP